MGAEVWWDLAGNAKVLEVFFAGVTAEIVWGLSGDTLKTVGPQTEGS